MNSGTSSPRLFKYLLLSPSTHVLVRIDLGTTNSLAVIFRDVKPDLFQARTPSAVSHVETDQWLVGLPAREPVTKHALRTPTAFER
jgi:molecular chaperone DnaK (HSP70)